MPNDRPKSQFFEFEDFRVDVDRRSLSRAGEPISLTPKVFEMLVILLEHREEVVPKGRLMELLWPDSFVEESNLTQNVAVLRKALGDSSKQPKYILTVPGTGYRFVGDLEEGRGDSRLSEQAVSTNDGTESARARSSRSFVPMVVVGIVLLAAAGTVYLYLADRAANAEAPEVARTGQVTSWSGLDFYPSISPDGNSITYSSDRSGSFEIYTKQLLQSAREVQVTSDGGQNFQPKFSPDGLMIAYHSKRRGGLWVIPATGGTAKQITDFGSAPTWSSDGTQIAFQSDPLNDLGSNVRNAFPPSTIWVVPARGGEARQITRPGTPPGGHGAPSWSPDGKTLVFDTNDWNSSVLATVDLATGVTTVVDTKIEPTPGVEYSASDAIYAPDGRSIFFIANTGLSVQMLPVSSSGLVDGKASKVFDASGTRVRQISLDRSGKRMVYASLTSASNIWSASLTSGARQEILSLTQNSVTRTSLPQFSPDGKKIAYQAFTIGSISHLWTMNSDGSDQKQLSSRPGFSSTWASDGSKIYFVSPEGPRTAMWYVSADAAIEKKLFEFDEPMYTVRPSPDGRTAVFASKRSGAMNLWTVPMEGGIPSQLTFDPEFAGFPVYSPDGKWLAFQIKRGDNTYVAVMPATGGEMIQINSEPGQSWLYDWSPDSDKVLFAGQRDGLWNVYWVSRSTKEQKQITNLAKLNSFVRYPTWSPLNDKIAFEYSETTGNIWIAELK